MTAATVKEYNLFWPSVPWPVQIPFLVCDILLLGCLEGCQISFVALKNHNSEAFKQSHPRAYACNKLCQVPGNLERFLVGRQVFVVVTVFFGSYVTTQSDEFTELFGWEFPGWVGTAIFQTGLMGVLVVAIFGQLMVQVVASSYPINFVEVIPFAYWALVGCLWFERTGIVYFCYKAADFFIWATGMKNKDNKVVPLRLRGFSRVFKGALVKSMSRLRSKSSGSIAAPAATSSVVPAKVASSDTKEISESLVDVVSILEKENPSDTAVMQEAMRRYPHLFNNFPTLVGGKVYASPQQTFAYLKDRGYTHDVPPFLQPTSSEDHVPPHIFVCQLLSKQNELRRRLEQAQAQVRPLRAYGQTADKDVLDAMTKFAQARPLDDLQL